MIVLYFVKGRLTVEVGAAQELDVVCAALGGEAGVTDAGVAGLAEVSRLLWRTHILLVIGLTALLSNFRLRFLQFKFWHLWHTHSVRPVVFWSLNK